jgi:hypothetical protein
MIDRARLITELYAYAHGAEIKEYSENLAIDSGGELVKEVYVKCIVTPVVSEIEVTISFNNEQI